MAKKEKIECWTADDFRPHIGEVITDLREGNLFTVCGLTESDNILEDDESPPPRTHKGHPFNILLEHVAVKLVKENGWEKKTKKNIYKRLRQFSEEWADEIRRYPPTGSVAAVETPNSKSLETPNTEEVHHHSIHHRHLSHHQHPSNDIKHDDDDMREGGEMEEEEAPLIKKTAAKSTITTGTTHNRQPRDYELSEKERYQKEVFERERDEILKEIPDDVKSRFGQIMFAKWSNNFLPVLVMSPFQVPPGGVRDMWYTMYDKVKSGNRLNNMTNLIYWYGAYQDQANAYSFVTQSKLIPFDVGCKKGYDQLPKPAAKKKPNEQLIRGLEEMREDIAKKPEERSGRMGLDFLEVYQLPSESEDDEMEQPVLPKKRGRKKKSDLMKKAEEAANEQATTSITDKKKKKKPGRKRKYPLPEEMEEPPVEKKKKKIKVEQEEMEVDQEEMDASTPITSLRPVIKEEYVDEGIMSHHKKDDEDIDDFQTESDEGDEDYDDDADVKPRAKPGPKPKKKKPGPKPKKMEKQEESTETNQTPKKRGKPGPKPKKKKKDDTKSESSEKGATVKKAPSLAKMKRMEQAKFAECEQMFCPIIQRWEAALEDKNTSALEELYEDICALVGQFSAPFIEEYNLYPLIKLSKQVHDGPNRKKLYLSLKEAYTQKKNEVPEGFKPKKSKVFLQEPKKRDAEKPAQQEVKKRKKEAKTESAGKNERLEKAKSAKESKTESGDKNERLDKTKSAKDPNDALTESTEIGAFDVKEKTVSKDGPPPDVASPLIPPIKRTGSMENVSVPEQDSQGGPSQKKETPAKVERKKKFSLGSLMRPTSSAPKLASKSNPIKRSSSTGQLSQQKKMPVWISQPPADTPGDQNRSYALTFLRQAAPFIPQSKHVNHDAIALALEAAVYEWAGAGSGGSNWLDKYWEKIHEIVASISGKRKKPGTIAALIAEGRFKSPDEIVQLPDDVYIDSFEGRAVTI